MQIIKMNKLILGTIFAFLLLGLSTSQTNAQTPVKGQNVTKVTVGNNNIAEAVFVQVAPKKWNHYYPDGKRLHATHTETGRDEWSVYLTSENIIITINLFKKTVTYVNSSTKQMTYSGTILNASNSPNTPSSSPPNPATTNNRSTTVATKGSPLTGTEMAKVMQWISIKTSAARLPFCWRQSYGRTAGKPMVCQAGYNQETAGLCYQPCKPGEKGIANSCYSNCPAGFRDDGLYCGKPAAYGRGVGYPWKVGDRVGSLDQARARCNSANPQGCEQNGLIIYPKCKAGFKPAGSNICSPICPSGFSDIGVSCQKPGYNRDVKPLTTCVNGLQKDGALCYPACQNNYTGRGPVCWQNCPVQQDVDCGAGCATTKGNCAKAVFNMTSTPIIAALKITGLILTAGGSSAATGGAAAASQGGKIGLQSPKLIKLAQRLNTVKALYNKHETSIKVALGTKTALAALQSEVDLFSAEFADSFGEMTSPEIEKEIDSRFSKEAALEIKKAWGIHHLSMNMEANVITTAKNFISVASIADPTGLASVANAFLNPLCKDSTPFPAVNPKY